MFKKLMYIVLSVVMITGCVNKETEANNKHQKAQEYIATMFDIVEVDMNSISPKAKVDIAQMGDDYLKVQKYLMDDMVGYEKACNEAIQEATSYINQVEEGKKEAYANAVLNGWGMDYSAFGHGNEVKKVKKQLEDTKNKLEMVKEREEKLASWSTEYADKVISRVKKEATTSNN
jgi:flagellar biosynthesis/type III secretory pathway protein FliH